MIQMIQNTFEMIQIDFQIIQNPFKNDPKHLKHSSNTIQVNHY